MSRVVPFLADEAIERDAASLLAEYSRARGIAVAAPIPVEDIVEKHLKLRIEFDDTHKLFSVPRHSGRDADILGAIFFNERRIVIDESLDPDERPGIEGRYRFTLAHEGGGHWRLHRAIFARILRRRRCSGAELPSVVCRSSEAKKREEWQADFYASSLLMPKDLLVAAWRERFGNANPRILRLKDRMILPEDADEELIEAVHRLDRQREEAALNEYVRPFAENFLVSMVAMRIRLERLGLIHREATRQKSLFAGS